jgi:predicted permease
MGAALLSGRAFTEHDDEKSPWVAVVNQALVRRFWPNQNPLGKRIYLGRLTTPMEVVGVTADIRNVALVSEASPEIYMPFAQRPWRSIDLILRTSGDPHTFITTARHLVATVDKEQPVTDVRTLDEVLAESRTQPRLIMFLLGVFSSAALLLAVVGIYGTLSYLVEQRTQELGIRMALGASRADILAMVMRQGMTITLGGVVVGTALSLVLTRLLAGLLFQVSGTDPATYIAAAFAFAAVALVAIYVPARRATRVDPILAMR